MASVKNMQEKMFSIVFFAYTAIVIHQEYRNPFTLILMIITLLTVICLIVKDLFIFWRKRTTK